MKITVAIVIVCLVSIRFLYGYGTNNLGIYVLSALR